MMGQQNQQKEFISFNVDLDRRVRSDHPLRKIAAVVKSRAGLSGMGGLGMKCRNMFEPNTAKTSPSRLRAMMVAIFISVFPYWLFLGVNSEAIKSLTTNGH